MTLATATSALDSRFDPFLYAAVREGTDGAPLTVLSVLARLDIDPWEEAARPSRRRIFMARAYGYAALATEVPPTYSSDGDREVVSPSLGGTAA